MTEGVDLMATLACCLIRSIIRGATLNALEPNVLGDANGWPPWEASWQKLVLMVISAGRVRRRGPHTRAGPSAGISATQHRGGGTFGAPRPLLVSKPTAW